MEDICESELREAADFQVRPADLTGQVGALPEVAYGIWQPQGPRLAVPRFISATARRSLPKAMSSSDGPVTGEARNRACSMTPARSPRRLASDSFSDAIATRRRRWRSGGVVSAYVSATARWAAASSRRP
jgi:hypothetical protein